MLNTSESKIQDLNFCFLAFSIPLSHGVKSTLLTVSSSVETKSQCTEPQTCVILATSSVNIRQTNKHKPLLNTSELNISEYIYFF